MSTYNAPIRDMQFVLKELAGLEQVAQLPGGTVEGRIPLFVRSACMDAVMAVPPDGSKAEYLSAEQRTRCNEQTERDLAYLNTKLPSPGLAPILLKSALSRAFLPTVAHVPATLVAAAMSQLAVLLAAQVSDGRIERKRRLERREVAAARQDGGREERRARRRQAKDEQRTLKADQPLRTDKAAKAARAARASKTSEAQAARVKVTAAAPSSVGTLDSEEE